MVEIVKQHPELLQLAVGAVAGLILLSALIHVRVFAQMTLCLAAGSVAYVLYQEGVPGITARAIEVVEYLEQYQRFVQGLMAGKAIAGLFKWQIHRAVKGRAR